MNESSTDSLFTSDSIDSVIDCTWADMRLLHESERGWCSVYVSLHKGRRIVLKALKAQYRDSSFHKRLLRKEYAVGSMMSHRGIVAMLGFDTVPGLGEAILMEYVDGSTLDEYLATHPELSRNEQLNIVSQICAAVSYIHSHQMVHCDLKPSNILVTRDGAFIKIIDFGLCRGVGFDLLDLPGGTRGFTAPENMLADSKASIVTDVYSIGKILELMDGRGQMKGVWRKCVSKNVDYRPKSANEIIDLISRRHSSRKRGMFISAVAATAILAGGIYFLWQHNHPMPEGKVTTLSESEEQTRPSSEKIAENSNPESLSNRVTQSGRQPAELKVEEPQDDSQRRTVDTDSPEFKARLAEKFQQAAGRRFKDHLTLIDTMTTVSSNQLQLAGHWRWLVKQDMRKWLETELQPDTQKVEEIMKEIERYVNFYASFSFRLDLERSHRQEAAKRHPELNGAVTRENEEQESKKALED